MAIKVTCAVRATDVSDNDCAQLVFSSHKKRHGVVVLLIQGPDGSFEYEFLAEDLIAAIKNCQNA